MTISFQVGLVVAAVIVSASAAKGQGVTVDEARGAAADRQSVLTSAKNLYAAASYEAALLELNASDAKDDADQIDTYKALCFLALDRQQDAERTLQQIVERKPLYAMNEAEYSPRLVTMFRDVRKRALPAAALQLYGSAKADFEQNRYAEASSTFTQLLSVLADPDVVAADKSGRLSDLKLLADGFLKLAGDKLAEATRAAAQAAALAPAAAAPAPAAAPETTFTTGDAAIQPPVVLNQTMPDWRRPRPDVQDRVYSGRLQLVIDEKGLVEKATLVKSIYPAYDADVLQATRRWRYQPAMKDGQPVKFLKYLDITIAPGPTAR